MSARNTTFLLMQQFYHRVFYQPLLNALVVIYQTIGWHDLGLSIIILTIIVRLLLFPFFQKTTRYQMKMQKLQPHIKKIKEKHRGNKEKEVQETLELLREHELSPFSSVLGVLFLIVQLPILIALFQIFRQINVDITHDLYSFVQAPGALNNSLLGLINLRESSMVLVILAAAGLYIQGKLGLPKIDHAENLSREEKFTQQLSRQMVFTGPFVILLIFGLNPVPAAVPLYLVISTAFSIVQQVIISREIHGNLRDVRQKSNRTDVL